MSGSKAASSVLAVVPRRRYLTIMFSDLSDSTRLAEAMEAEIYSALLARLREVYWQVIPRHGGTVVRIQGDGLLAIFGYPNTLEDDGRRATEAALELHDRVRRLRVGAADAPTLSLHTGVHSGLVLLEEGDDIRGRFDPLGNAPNVAARLSAAADRDEILVSAETLGSESYFFDTGAPRTLMLKGVGRPTTCLPVLGRAAIQTRLEARTRRGVAPFVGRAAELLALEHALDDALSGKPRCIAVSAAPGLGKTRLAEEFLSSAAARGCHVVRGYCESYLGAEPLQPILQMLRAAFNIQPGMPTAAATDALLKAVDRINPVLQVHRNELLRVLSLAAGDTTARDTLLLPAQEPTRIALRDLFDGLAAMRPLVVFIDDWQWADDITKQVVEAICRLESRPVLVLIATRGFAAGEADMLGAEVLQISPFDDHEAAQIVERLLPAADPFVASQVQLYAGGNPLFIEELCHSAGFGYRQQDVPKQPGREAWLNTLIESRVARLPADQADVVHCAAVIGTVVPAWLLHRLIGVDAEHPLIQRLAEQDLLFPGDYPGTLRFKHGITRDVIYGAVGMHQRRALHLAVARAIVEQRAAGASEDASEMLAYHYGAAGMACEAAEFAELAGDKAVAASALDRAKEQYRAALAALDLLPASAERDLRWNAVAERLGLACVFDPAREDVAIFERAVSLATGRREQGAIARAHYWLGYIHYALGESGPAIRHCETALAAARLFGADPLVVQISATLGQVRAAVCDYDAALALLDEAIFIKRSHRSGTRPAVGLAYTLACKGSILGDRGHFTPAHLCFDEALDAVRGAGHQVEGSVLCWRAAVHLWQGRWSQARDDAWEARRIAERVKSLYVFAMSYGLGAYAEWTLEQDPDSLRRLADATSWLEQRDKGLFISLNYGWLAEGMASAGRFREARSYAARALHRARKKDRIGEAVAYRALARLALDGRARLPAEHYLERALQAALARTSQRERALTRLSQADVAAARGAYPAAANLFGESAAEFHALGMTWHARHAGQRLLVVRSAGSRSGPVPVSMPS
jgi:class 3 adenylate cyclase/tetratricopeptide (TPR) repeat protein